MRRTKIIATIGPACSSPAMLKKLFKAGVNVCRLNFSYGSHEEHRELIERIRKVSAECCKCVAIMQDLQGPKIRVAKLNHPVEIKRGDIVTLSGKTEHKEELVLPTTYAGIAADTKPGKTILMADGRIILQVVKVESRKKMVHCKVLCGGTVLTGKGINLPYTNISLPALTPKDMSDAEFGISQGVDYLALSFVRAAKDVTKLRRLIKKHGADIPIVAKLEKPEALDNLDAILDVVDGVMVARGDLADEISFAKVPSAQKHIIKAANQRGRLTIVATEMLCSMIDNPLPTRAEVSDVANAVIDGADMVMLSNETAMGANPPLAVKTMGEIALEAEKLIESDNYLEGLDLEEHHDIREALCMAISFLSFELSEKGIAVLTLSGATARLLSKLRPECPIIAATHCKQTWHRMAAYNNVEPVLLTSKFKNARKSFEEFRDIMLSSKKIKPGDRVLVLTGEGEDVSWSNSIRVATVPKK
jgi:pyruvate kinase